MNEVYRSFFPEEPPSRACIQTAGLPPWLKIEMQVVTCTAAYCEGDLSTNSISSMR